MEKQRTNIGTFFKGLLMGSLIFGAVALFTAPHSGAETRQIIRDKGEQLRKKTEETVENVRERVDTAILDVRQRTEKPVENISMQ